MDPIDAGFEAYYNAAMAREAEDDEGSDLSEPLSEASCHSEAPSDASEAGAFDPWRGNDERCA